MPSSFNTQTQAISGFGMGKELPDGMYTVNQASANGLTALAGGGQAGATILSGNINRITVCATAGDSAILPQAVPGLVIYVTNTGAAYANIFPFLGDIIGTLAANVAVSNPVGATLRFSCAVAGTWDSAGAAYPAAKFTTGTTTTTFAAGQLTGGATTNYANTGATPGTITTRTATQMFADDPYARVGGTYILKVVNAQGTGTLTMAGGTGVTITGTATIAINTSRTFNVTYNSATTMTLQNVDTGVFS